MANPLEDQIYAFIVAHRPLKLFLLFTTTVAIAWSSVGMLKPVIEIAKPMVVKGLGLKAPQITYLRYECIARRVATSTKIVETMTELESEPLDTARSTLLTILSTLEHCQTLLGVPQFIVLTESLKIESTKELIPQAQQVLIRNDEHLAAHLARTSIMEYNLLSFFHYLHEALSFSTYLLESSKQTPASDLATSTLRQRAESANQSYRKFASMAEYKVPDIQLMTESVSSIHSSAEGALTTFQSHLKGAP